jgi:formylglycine-generating enzyme
MHRRTGPLLVAAALAAVVLDARGAPPKVAPKGSASASGSASVSCPPGMVFVPGGTFLQGSDARTVAPFCLDRTEVTVGAYGTCAATGTCAPAWKTCVYPPWTDAQLKECATLCNGARADRLDHPINCVDQTQAIAYCKSLGKHLPSHAEWEWAARGAALGRTFPWGDDEPTTQLCWSGGSIRTSTCAVGQFPAGGTPQGVLDLAGNVQEWTASTWPGSDTLQITKGGTFAGTTSSAFFVAKVNADPASNRHNALGFRCAR